MFTRCPSCDTAFRITAEQLAAAHGRVRCGRCQKVFNALECISDGGLPPPGGDRPGQTAHGLPLEMTPTGHAESSTQAPEEASAAESATGVTDRLAVEVPQGGERYPSGAVAAADDSLDVLLEELPPALREDLLQQSTDKGRLRGVVWSVAALLLILLLLLQLAWTFQEALIARIPALAGVRDSACALLDCPAPVLQAPHQAIRMLARDVRKHPRYKDTLLVNGTLVNQADRPLPFPLLQFGLYNVDGVLIGARRFKPEEYLDQSIDIAQGMLPGQPVHIVLELTGISDAAVSFEFDFL